MTWQHFLRTMAVAGLGAAALALASQARAESSIVSPEKAEAAMSAAAAEARAIAEVEAEAAAEQEAAADAADPKKAKKTAKQADKKKPKEAAESKAAPEGAKQPERAAAEAAATPEGTDDAIQTAAIPLGSIVAPSGSRSRQSDAAKALALRPLITQYASENGIPYSLADAVVRIESRYNPGARNGPNMGLTQINFRTAQSLGYQGAAAGLLDAETNLRFGLKYLAQAYKLAGGDMCGTILRYQFGHRTTTMTGASRAYCARVKVITAAAE
jgi:soluble lytic murein transglycosylase-like protein